MRKADALLRASDAGPLEHDVRGVRYALATEDIIDFNLLYAGGYQSSLVRYLADTLATGAPVLWDVGANVGSVSLPVAAAAPGVRIHSFEPSPAVHRRLLRNLSLNPGLAGHIHPHAIALADTDGDATFYESNQPFNSGVGGFGRSGNQVSSAVRVAAARGDTLIQRGEIPAPSLLKIDVEGFEGEVLRGLTSTLGTGRVEVIFEHCPYRMRERGMPLRAHCDLLTSLGYALWFMEPGPVPLDRLARQLTPRDLEGDCDIIARKT